MLNISTIDEIMTVEETGQYLKICKVSTYNLFHTDGFPYFRIGNSLRICKTDLLQWVKTNLVNKSN